MKRETDSIVTIIIPFYDTDKRLFDDCLKSVSAQTYKKLEILLINDGSTHADTISIAEIYSLKEERCCLFNRKKAGVSEARNFGLAKSSGNYILFVDSDDTLDADCVENLLKKAKEEKSNIIFAGKRNSVNKTTDVHIMNRSIDLKKDGDVIAQNLSALSSQGVLIVGELARKYMFNTKLRKCEDVDYMLSVMSDRKARAYIVGTGGYNYIQNNNSVTHAKEYEDIMSSFDARERLLGTLKKHTDIDDNAVMLYKILNINATASALTKNKISFTAFRKRMKSLIKKAKLKRVPIGEMLKRRSSFTSTQLLFAFLINIRALFVIYLIRRLYERGKQ